MPKSFPVIVFFFVTLWNFSSAQILISGNVASVKTEEPLPYASIFLKNHTIGTTTNENGDFELKIPKSALNDTVVFSYLGYSPYGIKASEIDSPLDIYLSLDTTSLSTVVVTAESAKSIVKKAIRAIPQNYPTDPFITKGFYRITSTNGYNYVHLSESVFSTYQSKNSKPHKQFVVEQVRSIKDLRSSRNINLGVTPNGLYSFDIIDRHDSFILLSKKGIEKHEFKITGYESLQGRPVYKIEFDQKGDDFAGYKGYMLIDTETMAFLYFDMMLSPKGAHNYKYGTTYKRSFLRNINGIKITIPSLNYISTYRLQKGKYYLESIRASMKYDLLNQNRDYHLKLESDFEYVVTSIVTENATPFGKKETLKENRLIEYEESNFDKEFWSDYTIIVPTVDFEKEARRITARNEHFLNK